MKLVPKASKEFKNLQMALFLLFVKNVYAFMSVTTSQFQTPPLAYTKVLALITALEKAILEAMSRARGTAELQAQAFDAVKDAFSDLADYVSDTAKGNIAIIEAAGFVPTASESVDGTVTATPIVKVISESAIGEVSFSVTDLGPNVTHNYMISTDLSELKRIGNVFVNLSPAAITYNVSVKQKTVLVRGLPSLVPLYVACYTTNTAGNSNISTLVKFSCK